MDCVNYDDFHNICRFCLLKCEHKIIQDVVISKMYYLLMGIRFETNDQLPQQICLRCFEKITELNAFALQCKQSHFNLMKCLENYKNTGLNANMQVTDEYFYLDEITIQEHKIEFVKDGDKLQIKSENTQETSAEIINNENINFVQDDYKNSENTDSTSIKELSNAHEKKHTVKRPIKCEICNKSFNRSSNLNVHKRIHRGERPFECDICNKTFTQSNDLNRHKRVHSGERPYKCEICIKTFNQSQNLNKHKFIHSDERPYSCELCNKSFKRIDYLNKHKCAHSGERAYMCEICNKLFNRSDILNKHKRVHSGERLESSSVLKSNKTVHDDELLRKCDICSKTFKRLALLNGHQKTHHENLTVSDDDGSY